MRIPQKEYFEKQEREEVAYKLEGLFDLALRFDSAGIAELKDKRAKVLVCGSANTGNLNSIINFLKTVQGNSESVSKDSVIIIDVAPYSINRHKSIIRKKIKQGEGEFQVFSLAKMDMTEIGLKPGKIDLVISDFTLNFENSAEAIAKFFREIATAIKHNGFGYMRVFGNPYFYEQDKFGFLQDNPRAGSLENATAASIDMGDVATAFAFPLVFYKTAAEEAGLRFQVLERNDEVKLENSSMSMPQFFVRISK